MTVETDFHITDADFQMVRNAVYEHCGISLNDEKKALVRARLAKQVRAGGFQSVDDYLRYALNDRNGDGFTSLIDSISTNLTSFFREKDHFNFLQEQALPAMLQRKRQTGESRLLAWSAACSSGEEPYSLGMTILEFLAGQPPEPIRWEPRLLATDISTRVLARARAGHYEQHHLANVPPDYRERYFNTISSDQCSVCPELRRLVQFRHLNLMDAWPFKGPFDLIFCRNVMIYFDLETQQRLVDRFWNCLRTGGLLFTGHSESLTRVTHRFVNRRPSIYEKV
ncbi:MAG TPA: protein-glutamate O-methyltransferase CheR [Tepidisphaeraceae bacterium]|nr:protein-glutamate O-methyltransferase CheR [Tepidisphaeraceae bacterium]